eukprot:GGOE01058782.1.p1 GENE.GGOE01058782.1~~GGOE01058782.1.p1  ORF type:complete len:504 (+),score=122.61 GGOE01058782.1:93-1604(+)
MQGQLLDGQAFLVVALRSQEKGTRTLLRYPLNDESTGGDTEKELSDHKVATSNHASHLTDETKETKEGDAKGESTTDLLSPIIPMLFPNSSECSSIFTLAAKNYVFITHFVNSQPVDAGNIPEAFIFVLGLQNMEFCDLWSQTIAQYKLLLQQFTFTCIRENLRCDFLVHELQALRVLRDKCDNWAEFNRQALLQSELAQEIKMLVDGINKPTAENVQVRINGFVTLEMPLPRASTRPSAPRTSESCRCIRTTEPQRTMLMLHPSFNFSDATVQKFLKTHPKFNFFDTIRFFMTAQSLDSYFDRMKLRSKRDGGLRAKSTDHLQWLLEHKVLKVVEPHYLLLYAHGAPAVRTFRPLPPSASSTPSAVQVQHPAVLYCDSTSEALQVVQDDSATSFIKRSAQTRSRSDVGSSDWSPFSVPQMFEEGHLDDKRPPKHLHMPREDWQALLRLARDHYRSVFEALCEHNLLDGRHSRNEIIHRHGIREPLLDHLLQIFSGHIVTIWA